MANLFDNVPASLDSELFDDIVNGDSVRIERILSLGHRSPPVGWYDQEENEWVIVLKGKGIVEYEDGQKFELAPGDYLNIPAHQKHKVSWTDPEELTLWLAVFYR